MLCSAQRRTSCSEAQGKAERKEKNCNMAWFSPLVVQHSPRRLYGEIRAESFRLGKNSESLWFLNQTTAMSIKRICTSNSESRTGTSERRCHPTDRQHRGGGIKRTIASVPFTWSGGAQEELLVRACSISGKCPSSGLGRVRCIAEVFGRIVVEVKLGIGDPSIDPFNYWI